MQRDDAYLLDILIVPDPVNAETRRAQREHKNFASLPLCDSALK